MSATPPSPSPPVPPPGGGGPGTERNLAPPAAAGVIGVPLAPPARPRPAPPRDALLRLTLFSAVLGAILTTIYAWVLARQDAGIPTGGGFPGYERVVVPVLALAAMAGALWLDRLPALGMSAMLLGTGVGLTGGAVYLAPATLLACAWAARHNRTARGLLGFALLIPGSAAGYYGIMAGLSFLAGQSVPGLPPSLTPPATLAAALTPLDLLPAAVLGAWLLVAPAPRPTAGPV